jgi:PadR family transcriptional regulator, regulatory protein PadR
MAGPKMTQTTLAVLREFIEAGDEPRYGRELAKAARISSGTLYPILDRLEEAGWIEGDWEDIDPSVEGRPRRRYYTLTASGSHEAVTALRIATARLAPTAWLREGWASQ